MHSCQHLDDMCPHALGTVSVPPDWLEAEGAWLIEVYLVVSWAGLGPAAEAKQRMVAGSWVWGRPVPASPGTCLLFPCLLSPPCCSLGQGLPLAHTWAVLNTTGPFPSGHVCCMAYACPYGRGRTLGHQRFP